MVAAKTLSVSINSWSGLQLRGFQLPIVDGIPKSLSKIADFKVHSGFICIPKLKMCQLKRSLPRFRQQAGNLQIQTIATQNLSFHPKCHQDLRTEIMHQLQWSITCISNTVIMYCLTGILCKKVIQAKETVTTKIFARDVEKVTDMFHNQLRAVFTYPSTVTTSWRLSLKQGDRGSRDLSLNSALLTRTKSMNTPCSTNSFICSYHHLDTNSHLFSNF